ncbi:response regulator transcription factor [Ferrovibrio xuzhouensis]|uniref:Response regulator transcription factor n=2 Tax=Ferrovibrio xuzhouensis TaxID=1576914 RepID=A0ABV7VEQ9_9PROT
MMQNAAANIYVIDDDEVVRDSLIALLEVRGYVARDFESGDRFLGENPDLAGCCIILDVHMPGMTGMEVLRRIRQRSPSVPAILITGRRDGQIQAQAEELGALALLDKPLSHSLLFGAIEQAFTAL